MDTMITVTGYRSIIEDICRLRWSALGGADLIGVAWAYYFFSIQFRENLVIAQYLYPEDKLLQRLVDEECNTDNLSPWPGVVEPGERANHDEFIRRLLQLTPICADTQLRIESIGYAYLERIRQQDEVARAMSIASFEGGGLERVFTAILTAPHWDTPLLAGFRHFLVKHIEFDSNPDGHGELARHLRPDERIQPLWNGFYNLLVGSVPCLKVAHD